MATDGANDHSKLFKLSADGTDDFSKPVCTTISENRVFCGRFSSITRRNRHTQRQTPKSDQRQDLAGRMAIALRMTGSCRSKPFLATKNTGGFESPAGVFCAPPIGATKPPIPPWDFLCSLVAINFACPGQGRLPSADKASYLSPPVSCFGPLGQRGSQLSTFNSQLRLRRSRSRFIRARPPREIKRTSSLFRRSCARPDGRHRRSSGQSFPGSCAARP